MDFELIRAVNACFQPFYPYAAAEIHAEYGRDSGDVLEIGPYGPGVALALAGRCSKMRLVCGDDAERLNDYLAETIAEAGMSARVRVEPIDKYSLPFEAASFDLVIFRGGLFFWEEQERLVAEMDRVLKPGGMGAHGGGFGAGAPDELIESLLPEARALNDRLGKKRLSRADVRQIAENAGLGSWRIAAAHGLWLYWEKHG
ncbi:MAG: class I SAM-dependent methyltransferase [Nitrospinae bacterium]|nr:class I SAM-dependent methyltransferase [Nitrospinota bacterium]